MCISKFKLRAVKAWVLYQELCVTANIENDYNGFHFKKYISLLCKINLEISSPELVWKLYKVIQDHFYIYFSIFHILIWLLEL